jgi:hypothetical protein
MTDNHELTVCFECVRAVALIGLRTELGLGSNWNTIARHRQAGDNCRLCGRGEPVATSCEFVKLVEAYRMALIEAGQGGRLTD